MIREMRNEKGMLSTEVAFALVVCIAAIAITMLLLQRNGAVSAKREELSVKALYVAEAGINDYIWHLNQNEDYINQIDPAQEQYQTFKDGEYFLVVTPTEDAQGVDLTSIGRVKIPETSSYKERTIRVTIQKKSFTNYIYFTDHETMEGSGNTIWFITGDTINGPLHSNDVISIDGNPVFRAPVSTARTKYEKTGSNPDFQQGITENVPPLEMPSTNSQLKVWAQSGGYYYYGKTDITMSSAGTLSVTNTNALSTGPKGSGVALPENGVIYVDGQAGTKYNATTGDIFFQGTLKGNLTVAAINNIYLVGDTLYSDQVNDMLGMVANNYIYVNHYNQSGSDVAPTNITISGAVFSLNHSFGFESYQNGPAKGTIHINGSIIQKYRGPVGTFSGSTRVSGYSKDYNYDQRMLYSQPPHFINPLNTGYGIVKWEEI